MIDGLHFAPYRFCFKKSAARDKDRGGGGLPYPPRQIRVGVGHSAGRCKRGRRDPQTSCGVDNRDGVPLSGR